MDQIGSPVEMKTIAGAPRKMPIQRATAATQAKIASSVAMETIEDFAVGDQEILQNIMPEDRRYTYEIRDIINTVSDQDSFLELRKKYGASIVTGFIRIEGKPFALLASDCQKLGGAIDSESAEKAADFIDKLPE